MLKILSLALLFCSLMVAQQPFTYSPNQYPQMGNAIGYHYALVQTDAQGRKYLNTYIVPRVTSLNLQPIGEGIYHVWEFLDFHFGLDPLPLQEPMNFGTLDEQIFSVHSIQLTPFNEPASHSMSPSGWGIYFPVAWISPVQQLSELLPSSSFHFDPFLAFGSPAIMTSSTLIPPSLVGLYFSAEHHTVTNFYTDAWGSGWGVLTTPYYFLLS